MVSRRGAPFSPGRLAAICSGDQVFLIAVFPWPGFGLRVNSRTKVTQNPFVIVAQYGGPRDLLCVGSFDEKG